MSQIWVFCERCRRRQPWLPGCAKSAFGALYANDNKAELTIVVTVVICRLAHKYAQMQHPLFGRCGEPNWE